MFSEWIPFVVIGITAFAIANHLGSSAQLRVIRNLVIAGALMRMVGVLARHFMIFDLYGGGSDAVGYFTIGSTIAEHFRALDFSVIGSGRWGDREWGTQVVRYAAGFVMTFVGPSVRGTFLVFSLAAFAGLVCTVTAVARTNAGGSIRRAAMLIFLWPTLWFWPSSIGKEAVLLLAVGLVTMGYVGRKERIRWVPLTTGLAIAMSVRPHLAGVLAVSICVAEWTRREWTLARMVQAMLASAVAVWVVSSSLDLLGLGGANLDSVEAFVVHTAGQTNQGGSAFERAGVATAVPMAFITILGRPFITEAHNAVALLSSLEMMAFWIIVFKYGRSLVSVLRSWQSNRLLRFALPFALLYVLMLGITFQNFGIIARQRALVMPTLLAVVAMAGAPRMSRAPGWPRYRRVWRHPTPQPTLASS